MAAQDVPHIWQRREKVRERCATAMVRAGLFVEVSTELSVSIDSLGWCTVCLDHQWPLIQIYIFKRV